MPRTPDSTPCQIPESFKCLGAQPCDSTGELNSTTDIQAALPKHGPRRRKTMAPQISARDALQYSGAREVLNSDARLPDVRDNEFQPAVNRISQAAELRSKPARRRLSLLLSERLGGLDPRTTDGHKHRTATQNQQGVIHMRKKPRRRTIYLPSEDTTIFTIHPGLQSTARGLEGFLLSPVNHTDNVNPDPSKRASLQAELNDNPRKPLAAAPKRAPLQPTLKPLQEHDDQQDIAGIGAGKENVPPGTTARIEVEKAGSKAKTSSVPSLTADSRTSLRTGPHDPNGALTNNEQVISRRSASSAEALKPRRSYSSRKTINIGNPADSIMKKRNSLYYGPQATASAQPRVQMIPATLPLKIMPLVKGAGRVEGNSRCAIIPEDITRIEMFHDTWLDDQQCAIQQLVNDMFDAAHRKSSIACSAHQNSRQRLLRLYQSSDSSSLYRRLQASLLHGALNRPNSSAENTSLRKDVGLHQRFLAIWTNSYDLDALHTAVEVVTGREGPFSLPDGGKGKRSANVVKTRKRKMNNFMEMYLLNNEDDSHQPIQGWCWRRTVLRSLMIVFLLDRAKEMNLIQGNLFQPSSSFKSSRSILGGLSRLLLPSIGDIHKLLSHLDYLVHHVQFNLSGHQYKINNVATDLRDGVKFARLTEILLCHPDSLLQPTQPDITSSVPTREVLAMRLEAGQSWVLSQHLKFPCITRAHRMYNVELTLSALRGVQGAGWIVGGLRPEHIVDGHRERTLTLLWDLVGKWGLNSLIDFRALEKEVHKLTRSNFHMEKSISQVDEDDVDNLEGLEKQTHWLRQWAKAIANRHGLKVLNLTTSFADGMVFSKIVDHYRPYLPEEQLSQRFDASAESHDLKAKLQDIGCSISFASIFGRQERCRVFDQDFTIAALAFFCSRLLAGSQRGRAAAVIQRAYRKSKLRWTIHERCRPVAEDSVDIWLP